MMLSIFDKEFTMFRLFVRLALVGLMVSFMAGCSTLQSRLTTEFKPSPESDRVFFEQGAEDLAHYIADDIEAIIIETEMAQYRHFKEPKAIQVYVFSDVNNYAKYSLAHLKPHGRATTNKIYISPAILDRVETLPNILMHELSHIHLRQFVGTLDYVKSIPSWFHDGLATDTSNGAGLEIVSIDEAIESFKQGKHFVLREEGRLLGHKSASDYGLKPHMYYRQTQLFIMFLKAYNSNSFKEVYISLTKKEPFDSVWQKHYGKELTFLWDLFIKQVKAYEA